MKLYFLSFLITAPDVLRLPRNEYFDFPRATISCRIGIWNKNVYRNHLQQIVEHFIESLDAHKLIKRYFSNYDWKIFSVKLLNLLQISVYYDNG